MSAVKMVIYESSDDDVKRSGLIKKSDLRYVEGEAGFKILHEFEAVTWHEAHRVYNDFFGFGPYVPFGDDVTLEGSEIVQKDLTFKGD